MRARRLIFTAGPWQSAWGDPDAPRLVSNTRVARELLHREGGGGTLVLLADGRFALTGSTYAKGTARALMRHALRRSRSVPGGDRAWLLIVTEELSCRSQKRRLRSALGRNRRASPGPSPVPH